MIQNHQLKIPYDDFIDKETTIKIVTHEANPPPKFTKKISEIIGEGNKNKS
jgi:hypothetical protein